MTFVLCGLLSSGNVSQRKDLRKKGRNIALQALFPLRGNFFRSFTPWDFFFFLFPPFRGGQGRQEGSHGAPCAVSGGAPSPPALPRSSERGGSASGHSSGARGRAPASSSPSGVGEGGAARSLQTPLFRTSDFVVSPQFSPHVPRRGNSRETSESCPRMLSSRGSRSSDRGSRKDKRAGSRESSSRGRRRRSRSRSSSRSRSRGREHRHRSSSSSLSSRARSRRERSWSSERYRSQRDSSRSRRDRSRSSDQYRSRRDRFRRDRSRSVDRYWSRRQRTRSPARRGERRERSRSPALPNRSRSSERLPGSPARLRSEETGRLARRETQEGVGAVASQPPVVSEAAAAATPVAGGAAITALPSVVQDLARFFLSLSGFSSQGVIRGMAGVNASAAASGGAACPSTAAGGAVTTCTTAVTPVGAGASPAGPAAVPGVSGEQQRQLESRSRRRRSRSSSDGTDRRAKKRARRRSPSPGRSSRRRGRHHRSSSDSSEDDRAEVSPPRSGRAHGGAPGGASSSREDDRSPRPGTSRSYARDDRYRSGAGRRSPGPSGTADDDRASTLESVDFARDDSFRAVLGLIRDFHDMAEPAGVPSARCKTSLASAYGLMSEVSPAFTLPASPLLRTLLSDINLQ